MISDEDKEKLFEYIRETPSLLYACKKVGIARATAYRWLESDTDFKEKYDKAYGEGVDTTNDGAQSQLFPKIRDGDRWAIAYWLSHNHPTYFPKHIDERIEKKARQTVDEEVHELMVVMRAAMKWSEEEKGKRLPPLKEYLDAQAEKDETTG